jgi:UDP-N-acetylglucosamine--N-acetylmuramyl-(pentapeptide) pyrophosphoryl-undecaprenol N-acetylglucosamine transferase
VYPLLVVAEELQRVSNDVDVLYVGRSEGIEASIVARTDLPYRSVDSGQIRGTSLWMLLRSMRRLWRGYVQAKALLDEWPADVVLVSGAYVSVPPSLAAWRRHIPLMIYLPDREPGLAVRLLSRFADSIAVSFQEARQAFSTAYQHKVWTSGYPVRAALLEADREGGYRALDLDPAIKILLVLGGSQGARHINQTLVSVLPELLARYQVIHISGQLDWSWVSEKRDDLSQDLQARYRAYAYMHKELSAAMAVADLAIARAGAATTAEFPAVGLPSILVPYPYSGGHQESNADFMVANGAAVRVNDVDLEVQLKSTVIRLLQDESTLAQMREKARALSKPDAVHRLAQEIHRLAHRSPAL